MILTGRKVEASEAYQMGLINRICEPGEAIDAAVKLAREITENPLIPMLNDRKSMYENLEAKDIDQAIGTEMKYGPDSVRPHLDPQLDQQGVITALPCIVNTRKLDGIMPESQDFFKFGSPIFIQGDIPRDLKYTGLQFSWDGIGVGPNNKKCNLIRNFDLI